MSKMSQLHAELSEQASELGFESVDDAIESGQYEVMSDGDWAKLVPTQDEQEKAHEVWLREKEELLDLLIAAKVANARGDNSDLINTALGRAADFIEKGEM